MAVLSPTLPILRAEALTAFHSNDDLLGNCPVLTLYGPSATAFSNTSRIQAHICMPGGVESYSRLGISPTSNFYAAVELLSREEQGDDVCRGLAFCLYKYFLELPEIVKEKWTENYASQPLPGVPIFGPAHAARLASRMTKVEAIERCLAGLEAAYAQQSVSWLLMRVVLPIGTVKVLTETQADSVGQDIESERAAAETRYGSLAPFIQALGRSTFVPTSKLRRAPSRPGGVSRSVSFARKQKEKVRREMCELLDTEESYVAKIRHLVEDIVKDIQQKLDSDVLRPIGGRRDMLESLFPPSLYDILQLNSAFLQALRRVVEETENNAIRDIQQSTEDNEDREECGFKPGVDVTGAAELADCLLVWFSEFKAPYQVYFQNKSLFSQSIRSFSASCPPDALNVIRTMGEQKLTSLLIEPVQRLPRYSLYIDSIVKQLPVRHDAIRKLLKARDMIADICADACDASDYNKVPDGLKRFITSWPPECSPRSRLVSAIDVEILDPPFVSQKHLSQRLYGILLMFAECLVILKKIKPTALSARGLVAELEKSPIQADEIPSLDRTADITSFAFLRWARLREVTVTEVNNGGAIRAIYRHPTTDRVSQTYTLLGSYENRAHRLTEDICKAKIECEFPETERENGKWEARTYTADLSILSAICEAGMSNSSFDTVKLRAVELFINPSDDDVQSNRARHQNDIFATLHIRSDDECMLSVFGPSGLYSEGQVSLGDLMPMLSRIVSSFLPTTYQIQHPCMTSLLVSQNMEILQSLDLAPDQKCELQKSTSLRSTSPVKLLTSFFGGAMHSSPKKTVSDLSSAQTLLRPPRTPVRTALSSPQAVATLVYKEPTSPTKQAATVGREDVMAKSVLESTFSTYLLALQARKGNIVGRSIVGRLSADGNATEALNNSLLYEPGNHSVAAEASVDTLLAAFELFLKANWAPQFGPVLSETASDSLQRAFSDTKGYDTATIIKNFALSDQAPNRDAFDAMMKSLAALLDGAGNDGDRGLLTAYFAELITPNSDYQSFIPILDLIIDHQGCVGQPARRGSPTAEQRSVSAPKRANSTKSGSSLTTTSSIRRKLGLYGLSRQNSKLVADDHDASTSEVSHHTVQSTASNFHGIVSSLSRSKSIETLSKVSIGRPRSQGTTKETIPGLSTASSRHNTSPKAASPVNSFAESFLGRRSKLSKKKRRSSLSDLAAFKPIDTAPLWAPPLPSKAPAAAPKLPEPAQPRPEQEPTLPILSPPLPLLSPTLPLLSPTLPLLSPPPQVMPPRKDVVSMPPPSPTRSIPRKPTTASHLEPAGSRAKSNRPQAPDLSPFRRQDSFRRSADISVLSERSDFGNVSKSPTRQGTLRVSGSQKLKDRLENEQNAVRELEAGYGAKMKKLGDELITLPSPSTRLSNVSSAGKSDASTASVRARLRNLELKFPKELRDMNQRVAGIESDLLSSLQASEAATRNVNKLCDKLKSENEVLHRRLDEELRQFLLQLEGNDAVTVVGRKLNDAQDQLLTARKEILRLERENAALKAQTRAR